MGRNYKLIDLHVASDAASKRPIMTWVNTALNSTFLRLLFCTETISLLIETLDDEGVALAMRL